MAEDEKAGRARHAAARACRQLDFKTVDGDLRREGVVMQSSLSRQIDENIRHWRHDVPSRLSAAGANQCQAGENACQRARHARDARVPCDNLSDNHQVLRRGVGN